MIHVYPVADERDHELEGTLCWCEPDLDWSNAGEAIVIHNAADMRELVEQANEIKDTPCQPLST